MTTNQRIQKLGELLSETLIEGQGILSKGSDFGICFSLSLVLKNLDANGEERVKYEIIELEDIFSFALHVCNFRFVICSRPVSS